MAVEEKKCLLIAYIFGPSFRFFSFTQQQSYTTTKVFSVKLAYVYFVSYICIISRKQNLDIICINKSLCIPRKASQV